MVVLEFGSQLIVHAGDSYFYHGQINPDDTHLPPGGEYIKFALSNIPVAGSFYQHTDKLIRLQDRFGDKITIFCTHDPHEFYNLKHTPLD